ncbi:WecB/TagA/CpsF family glycosyltransferase [Geobacter sp.]|uniref:WecB/TagA/CpsF family glycosyltransferase n=1 Tax=Geobacter sp. TaxID=46610 RepID=UPI002617338E|nr:WecB/TagA/CpsF family glycosyltransferase [Geobacter sp.]
MSVNTHRASILGARINALSWNEALGTLSAWGSNRESRYICICNVHSVVTAKQDPRFQSVINHADMATPDGMPLAWTLRRLGFPGQQRINGPDLMWKYCERAAANGQSIFLYGSTDATLDLLQNRLKSAFPALKIAGAYSPPFRPLSTEEEQSIVAMINDSGANVVFVGLGCPKQEFWMAEHRGRIKAVMIGVGAAFDYHAGTIKRAPLWMQNSGFEWLYRLVSEPRRLWRRYLVTNSLFVLFICRQFWQRRLNATESVRRKG